MNGRPPYVTMAQARELVRNFQLYVSETGALPIDALAPRPRRRTLARAPW